MTPTPDGNPTAPEQAPTSTPATPDQPTALQAPATPATPPAPAISPEAQAQIDAANARAQQLEESVRFHQSRADQTANQLKGVLGVTPQADPLTPYLKTYTDLGVAEDAARVLAQKDYNTDQRFTTLQGSMQAQGQVPTIMQQVYAQAPQMFANPAVVTKIENALYQAAHGGRPDWVNLDYALDVGAIASFRAAKTGNQQVPPPPQSPQFPSQFGPISGYQPQQPVTSQQPAIPPNVKAAMDAERANVAQRFGFNPNPTS